MRPGGVTPPEATCTTPERLVKIRVCPSREQGGLFMGSDLTQPPGRAFWSSPGHQARPPASPAHTFFPLTSLCCSPVASLRPDAGLGVSLITGKQWNLEECVCGMCRRPAALTGRRSASRVVNPGGLRLSGRAGKPSSAPPGGSGPVKPGSGEHWERGLPP